MVGHELVKPHLNLQVLLVRNNLDKFSLLKLVKFSFLIKVHGVFTINPKTASPNITAGSLSSQLEKPASDIGLVSNENGIEHSVPERPQKHLTIGEKLFL